MPVDIFADDDPATEEDKAAAEKLRAAEDEHDDVDVVETEAGIEVGPKEPKDDDDPDLSHKDKKQLRYHEKLEQARLEGEERARRASEETNRRYEARISHLEARQAPQASQEDVGLEDVRKRQKDLYTRNAGKEIQTGSQEEKDFETEAKALRDEEGRLMYQRERKREMASHDPRADQLRQRIMAKFPEMIADENAGSWMRLRYGQLMAEGKPAGMETLDKAAEDTRAQFRMKGQPPPTDGQRARYASGGGGGGGADKARVRLTKAQEGLADGLYSHIPDLKKRYATYYKVVIVPNMET